MVPTVFKRKCFILLLGLIVVAAASVIYNGSKVFSEKLRPPPPVKIFCQRNIFGDVLLVLVYHYPFYETLSFVKSNYERAFPNIVVCGPVESKDHDIIVVKHHTGYFGYECLAKAIRLKPGFKGYLYLNDDMIVNWWNFLKMDREKIWIGAPLKFQDAFEINTRPIPQMWTDWRWPNVVEGCEAAYKEIISKSNSSARFARFLATHHRNTVNKTCCLKVWSDMFYVPGRLASEFQELSAIFFKHKVFLSIGVAVSLSMLDLYENWEKSFGIYLPVKYGGARTGERHVSKEYSQLVVFIHPVKFKSNLKNRKLLSEVIASSKRRTEC